MCVCKTVWRLICKHLGLFFTIHTTNLHPRNILFSFFFVWTFSFLEEPAVLSVITLQSTCQAIFLPSFSVLDERKCFSKVSVPELAMMPVDFFFSCSVMCSPHAHFHVSSLAQQSLPACAHASSTREEKPFPYIVFVILRATVVYGLSCFQVYAETC